MPQKIFKRIGLRRDKNFSDLVDRKGALNNLLDTIVDVTNPDGTPGTFISEDLDAIRNLFAEGMSNSNYLQFVNSAVVFTDQNGQNRTLDPRFTYQNRLDLFESFSGIPRLAGGDGLTARYFNSDQIQDKKSTSIHALPVDDIFVGVTTGNQLPSDQLWDTGDFQYTGKIHPASVNANGGVKWEGFFIPTSTARHSFYIASTGAFSFDFQDPSYVNVGVNTYREYMRVSGITTSSCTAAAIGDELVLDTPNESRYIARGMNVTCDEPSIIRPGTKVLEINDSTGALTLENSNGSSVTEAFASAAKDIVFSRDIGDEVNKAITTQVLEVGRRYRIRARFYIPPNVDSQTIDRNIEFLFTPSGGTFGALIFTQLYNLDYDFSQSAKGAFIDFLDNSVGFGGGTLGGELLPQDYVEVKSTKKIDIKYEPKTSFSAINIKTFSGATWEAGKTVISVSGNTTNVEVGNYVFGTGIQNDTRITEVRTNEFILIDKPTTSGSGGASIDIIEHRGFVKKIPDCDNTSTGALTTNSEVAGEFITPTNAVTANGDVTISRTSNQTGTLAVTNVTDTSTVVYTFSDSFTTISTSAFTAGKQYRLQASTNMALKFVLHGAGGGTGGGAGGKLDATINITSGTNYTLIIGTVGTSAGAAGTLIQGAGGGAPSASAFSGGGFTGLFETETITATELFNNAILIAGGGGGKGDNANGGGNGGGTNGSSGSGSNAGGGGTQTSGGLGGNPGGGNGGQLLGGQGSGTHSGSTGGGGGGGYYGGGGGRSDANLSPGGQPGGGGSGFIDQTKGASDIVKFTNLDTGMLAITNVSDVPAYTRITELVSDEQVIINLNSAFSSRDVYFYQSRGLINKSLDTFCVPAVGASILCRVLNADANAFTSIIELVNITGVQIGHTVTGFGVQAGTTVFQINGNEISLSLPLVANIKAGATVTIASASEGNKGLCCPPTDTSPPFEPTNEGLKTPTANPDLIINQGNLIFDNISATVNPNDYNFLRKDNAAAVLTNNFSLYDLTNGETAGNFLTLHTGVDFSNPASGTAYRILMQEVNI